MITNTHYEQCLSFLNYQLTPGQKKAAKKTVGFRAVTLSREAGSGGRTVAEHLADTLNTNSPRKPACPWTIFDRNLVDKVLEDHQLPSRLAKFFPEDRLTEMQDIMDEVFGLRPASLTIVQQTSETLLQLAALGNVILIGRASNIVTRKLPDVLHVRLVGSLEIRARRLAETRGMTRKSALEFINREDLGRRRYAKKYFGADIDDSRLYHFVINTDIVATEDAASLIARIVTNGF
jgi:cytidylate kinase